MRASSRYALRNGEASDLNAECDRYGQLLESGPIDLMFIGFGENSHIAFNDPHAADFYDPKIVKCVEMDERCRQQQIGEGHFPDIASMPHAALSLTCPTIMAARHLV